ncbi:hypothetical protein Tco_0098194 [Tanacetum coccineum]
MHANTPQNQHCLPVVQIGAWRTSFVSIVESLSIFFNPIELMVFLRKVRVVGVAQFLIASILAGLHMNTNTIDHVSKVPGRVGARCKVPLILLSGLFLGLWGCSNLVSCLDSMVSDTCLVMSLLATSKTSDTLPCPPGCQVGLFLSACSMSHSCSCECFSYSLGNEMVAASECSIATVDVTTLFRLVERDWRVLAGPLYSVSNKLSSTQGFTSHSVMKASNSSKQLELLLSGWGPFQHYSWKRHRHGDEGRVVVYEDYVDNHQHNRHDKAAACDGCWRALESPNPTVYYFDDLDYFKDFENEFPAIIYNDGLTSKSDLEIKPLEYYVNGILFFLIINLYVLFGIPFDPKRYYKDSSHTKVAEAKLGGVRRRMTRRQFILALGLHTEQEMAEASMDRGTTNIQHLLAQYMFRHAEGRKSGARLSGGHFIRCLAMYFGLINGEGLRGLRVVTQELPLIDLHELERLNICMRFGDTWASMTHKPKDQRGSRLLRLVPMRPMRTGQASREVAQEIPAPT